MKSEISLCTAIMHDSDPYYVESTIVLFDISMIAGTWCKSPPRDLREMSNVNREDEQRWRARCLWNALSVAGST